MLTFSIPQFKSEYLDRLTPHNRAAAERLQDDNIVGLFAGCIVCKKCDLTEPTEPPDPNNMDAITTEDLQRLGATTIEEALQILFANGLPAATMLDETTYEDIEGQCPGFYDRLAGCEGAIELVIYRIFDDEADS